MKSVQTKLLNRYMELRQSPSLREISKETGIQQTRVFRVFNGYELKLNEYIIFKQIVEEIEGGEDELLKLTKQIQNSVPQGKLKMLVRKLKRELDYAQLLGQNEKLA